jgi:hypothetical protein
MENRTAVDIGLKILKKTGCVWSSEILEWQRKLNVCLKLENKIQSIK